MSSIEWRETVNFRAKRFASFCVWGPTPSPTTTRTYARQTVHCMFWFEMLIECAHIAVTSPDNLTRQERHPKLVWGWWWCLLLFFETLLVARCSRYLRAAEHLVAKRAMHHHHQYQCHRSSFVSRYSVTIMSYSARVPRSLTCHSIVSLANLFIWAKCE